MHAYGHYEFDTGQELIYYGEFLKLASMDYRGIEKNIKFQYTTMLSRRIDHRIYVKIFIDLSAVVLMSNEQKANVFLPLRKFT